MTGIMTQNLGDWQQPTCEPSHFYGCNTWKIMPSLPSLVLGYKKLHPDAKIPTKGTLNAAAFDLYCLEDIEVLSGATVKIRTGIALEIPYGYFGMIKDRSSLAAKGIITVGGIIDSDYRGEIFVCQTLTCISHENGYPITKTMKYTAGIKIAQLLILPVPEIYLYEVKELSESERGDKGFGSTGK